MMTKNNALVICFSDKGLEDLSEQANKVSIKFRNDNPQIPWSKMVGLRNILIHEYFGVDLEIVWQTVENELPNLGSELNKL